MGKLAFITLILLIETCAISGRTRPAIMTRNGVVLGSLQSTASGKVFAAFLGIPYAQPPVGELRFQPPQKITSNWPTKRSASEFGSECLQYSHASTPGAMNLTDPEQRYETTGKEDCLFVNVYAHKSTDPGGLLPVGVVIHGGAFTFGTGNSIGPDIIMDHPIVLVTFNYRLGALGFLNTGDQIVPGNNGLKDQVAALEWVQDNIASFGGDPKRVTLLGFSSGGTSVHYHYLSQLSRGLFHRGYAYSGRPFAAFPLPENGPMITKKLANHFKCPTSDNQEMVVCLRKIDGEKLVAATFQFQEFLYNPMTVFGPVIEPEGKGAFISKNPKQMIDDRDIADLPYVLGTVANDGLYTGAEFLPNEELVDLVGSNPEKTLPYLLLYNSTNNAEAVQKITNRLDGDVLVESPSKPFHEKLLEIMTTWNHHLPTYRAVWSLAQFFKSPIYHYIFNYRGERSASDFYTKDADIDLGVSHGDDFFSVFNIDGLSMTSTRMDKEMSKQLTNAAASFIQFGVPNKIGNYWKNWKASTPGSTGPGLVIDQLKIEYPTFAPRVREHDFTLDYDLWYEIVGNENM